MRRHTHTYAHIQHMHAQWPETNAHMYTYALHSPSMPMMNTSPQTVPMYLYGLAGHAICIGQVQCMCGLSPLWRDAHRASVTL